MSADERKRLLDGITEKIIGCMKHGQFSEDKREFVITNSLTPRPWHNYLCNAEYLVNLTQFGTGASFWQPRGEGLRANITEDRDGNGGPRFVFLRVNETGKYWSLTGAPGHRKIAGWKCRIGLGYQINESKVAGIAADPRVQAASPRVYGYGLVSATHQSAGAQFLGVVPEQEQKITVLHTRMVKGSYLAGQMRKGVVMGDKLATTIGVEVGSEIVLLSAVGWFDGK